MNDFYKYASSCSFRVELTRPQIAKLYEVGKAIELNDPKFSFWARNDLIKTFNGHDNFLATEHALQRKGLINDTRGTGSKFNCELTPEGKALLQLLIVSGFCVELEKVTALYSETLKVG